MEYTVSGEVLQNMLNYLASRPYAEVSKLIADLQASAKPTTEPTQAATESQAS